MGMSTGLRLWVAAFGAAFVAVCGQAQDLKTCKEIYEKNSDGIRGGFQPRFDGLQQQYQKSLEALKSSAVNQGDLARTTAAIVEIDRFKKAKSLPAVLNEIEVPEITVFQTAYIQQYATMETDMTSQLGMLTMKYEQALERLQKERVKAMKLDEAKEIQQEREKAQVAIKSYAETLAALKGPAATNGTVVAAFPTTPAATGKTTGKQDLYMVIDLSRGTKAKKYPVKYLAEMPKSGWDDEYKTEKLVLRRIEPGTFMMGSPEDELGHKEDETLHTVTLSKPFYIGAFEVTQKQWELVMGTRPSFFEKDSASRPVERVRYTDIRGNASGVNWPADVNVDGMSFMGAIRARTGLERLDLPTEAQWEYACRAGTTTALNSNKNITEKKKCTNVMDVARCAANAVTGAPYVAPENGGTAAVGSYPPNVWGLYEMHGNVLEWCLDWYGAYSGDASDPVGMPLGDQRAVRGGAWWG
jgi:formylglycine-generating enzyme required for sulfatase activity